MSREPALPYQFRALVKHFEGMTFVHVRTFFRNVDGRWVECGDFSAERELWEFLLAPHRESVLVEEDRMPMTQVDEREWPDGKTGSSLR